MTVVWLTVVSGDGQAESVKWTAWFSGVDILSAGRM